MRAVIQRVSEARVTIGGRVSGEIGKGLLILLGIEETDDTSDVDWLVPKIISMRIFSDADDKMNLDIRQADGSLLVVSQFTLFASTKKGNRPSFIRAARPEHAIPLYECFLEKCRELTGTLPQKGEFGAMMNVHLVNDGPVTILVDTRDKQ